MRFPEESFELKGIASLRRTSLNTTERSFQVSDGCHFLDIRIMNTDMM